MAPPPSNFWRTGSLIGGEPNHVSPSCIKWFAGGFDLITLMFNYHDMGHLGVDRAKMNQALFRALKPGGIFVIAYQNIKFISPTTLRRYRQSGARLLQLERLPRSSR